MNLRIIEGLRKAGAKQLLESYPLVTAANITTDIIYKEFFKASLEETLEEAPQFEAEITALIDEINSTASLLDIA